MLRPTPAILLDRRTHCKRRIFVKFSRDESLLATRRSTGALLPMPVHLLKSRNVTETGCGTRELVKCRNERSSHQRRVLLALHKNPDGAARYCSFQKPFLKELCRQGTFGARPVLLCGFLYICAVT
jgi:hypothetical protein